MKNIVYRSLMYPQFDVYIVNVKGIFSWLKKTARAVLCF